MSSVRSVNIATKSGYDKFQKLDDDGDLGEQEFVKHLKDGTPLSCRSGSMKVFLDKDHYINYIDNGVIRNDSIRNSGKPAKNAIVVGAMVEEQNGFGANGQFAILCGDGGHNYLVGSLGKDLPTVSFVCLARLLGLLGEKDNKVSHIKAAIEEVACLFAGGDLELVDFTSETTKPLSASEKKAVKAHYDDNKKPLPVGEAGFSVVNGKWHRSGTVLIKDVRENDMDGKSYILGQDENAYFGCELETSPIYVDEAFQDLMPSQARGIEGVIRQGEWFAVPVDNFDVPAKTEFVARFSSNDYDQGVSLQVDDKDSSDHNIRASEGGVSKDGIVYAKDFTLTHSNDEHQPISGNGWYAFYRNTAKRSVSVVGVD